MVENQNHQSRARTEGLWHDSRSESGNGEIPMTLQDKTLVRKLAIVLLLKLLVLLALWWIFVREQRVTVDADAAATQLLGVQVLKTKE